MDDDSKKNGRRPKNKWTLKKKMEGDIKKIKMEDDL